MERIEYDPEIDPSIRREREAAERDSELSARIRIEIERYVEENDLVPRAQAEQAGQAQEAAGDELPPPWEEDEAAIGAEASKEEQEEETTKKEIKQARRDAKRAQKVERAKGRRKAIGSVFTGSILSSDRIRAMWPYLLALAVVLVAYIAHTFQLQKMNLEKQALEREIRELGVESLEHTAERVRATSRSAIVERLAEKEMPLEEFPHPVKTIKR